MKDILGVAANAKSKGTPLLLLLLMAGTRNGRGYIRVPYRVLEELSGMSLWTIKDGLARLCESGELRRVENGGGKAKPTTYLLMVGGEAPEFPMLPENYRHKLAWK